MELFIVQCTVRHLRFAHVTLQLIFYKSKYKMSSLLGRHPNTVIMLILYREADHPAGGEGVDQGRHCGEREEGREGT